MRSMLPSITMPKRMLVGTALLLVALAASAPALVWAFETDDAVAPAPVSLDATDVQVSVAGVVSWPASALNAAGGIYVVRWTVADSAPDSMASRGDDGYGSDWMSVSQCSNWTDCEVQIPDFDPLRHYVVQVGAAVPAEW